MTFLCKVLLLILATLSLRLSFAMDICKEKDKEGFKLKLLGTALFKDHLLLITRDDNLVDYTVYRVPFDNFDNSYGQMLLNIAGVPIEDYWPTAFKNDSYWKEMRGNVFSIWLIDNVNPYLYFFIPSWKGKTLDVNNGSWIGPLAWTVPNGTAIQWISDSTSKYTYTSECDEDVNWVYFLHVWNITLTQRGAYADSQPHSASHLYYTEHKKTKKVENITFIYNYGERGYIVTPENDPYLKMPGYEDYRLVNLTDWNVSTKFVPPGFIFKQQFHLFGLDKVFIFAHRLTLVDPGLKLGQIWYSTPIKAVPYKDYFKCQKKSLVQETYPPEAPPVSLGSLGSGGGCLVWLWIVIVIIVGLLLVFLLVGICYARKKSKDHHHHGDKKHSLHSRRSTGSRGTLKGNSLKRAISLKRNGSTKRQSTKLSQGTRRSGLKVK